MYKILATLLASFALLISECKNGKSDSNNNATSCNVTATVKDFTGLDGCKFLIVLENEEKLEPAKMPEGAFDLQDGQQVKIGYKEMTDAMSICMAGKIVEITCIELLEQKSPNKPAKIPCVETLDPYEVEWMQMAMERVQAYQVLRYKYLTDGFAYYFMGPKEKLLLDCQGTFLCESPARSTGKCDEKTATLEDELIIWEIE